jgi:hypothetical protein
MSVHATSSDEAAILLEGAKTTYRLELAAPAEAAQAAPRLLVQAAAASGRIELRASAELTTPASSTEPRILVQGAATSALQSACDPSGFLVATPAPAARILVQAAATSAEAKLARPVEPPPVPVDGGALPVWIWVLLGVVVGGIAMWLLARR